MTNDTFVLQKDSHSIVVNIVTVGNHTSAIYLKVELVKISNCIMTWLL